LIASLKNNQKKGVSNFIDNKYFLFKKERLKLPQQYIATKIFIFILLWQLEEENKGFFFFDDNGQ
jgi:hypothetical protein